MPPADAGDSDTSKSYVYITLKGPPLFRRPLAKRWLTLLIRRHAEGRVNSTSRERDVDIFNGYEQAEIRQRCFAVYFGFVASSGIIYLPQLAVLPVGRRSPKDEPLASR